MANYLKESGKKLVLRPRKKNDDFTVLFYTLSFCLDIIKSPQNKTQRRCKKVTHNLGNTDHSDPYDYLSSFAGYGSLDSCLFLGLYNKNIQKLEKEKMKFDHYNYF